MDTFSSYILLDCFGTNHAIELDTTNQKSECADDQAFFFCIIVEAGLVARIHECQYLETAVIYPQSVTSILGKLMDSVQSRDQEETSVLRNIQRCVRRCFLPRCFKRLTQWWHHTSNYFVWYFHRKIHNENWILYLKIKLLIIANKITITCVRGIRIYFI